MSLSKKLTAIFGAKDEVSDKLKNMGRAGEETSGIFSKIGSVAAVSFAAIGAAAVAASTKATIDFAQFEKGINEVNTLLDDDSAKAIGNIGEKVKMLALDMGVLPEKVVPALYEALSAGVPADNVFDFLATAQKAAIAGVTEAKVAVDSLTTVTNTYGSNVISAERASDIMFQTVKLGKTRFEELSASMANVLPSAKAAGVSFEQVGAMLATTTAQGVRTAESTTKIRSMLDELAKPGQKAADMFKELSGKGFRDFVAAGGTVQEALSIMNKKALETGGNIGDLFGSVEAASAAQLLTSENGAAMFTKFSDAMNNAAGSTEAAYQIMDKGIARTWERIKVRTKVALLDLGDALAPYVQKVSDAILNGMSLIAEYGKFIVKDIINMTGSFFEAGYRLGSNFVQGVKNLIANPGDGVDTAFQAFKENIGEQIMYIFGDDLGSQLSDKFLDGWYTFTDKADIVIQQGIPAFQRFVTQMYDQLSDLFEDKLIPLIQNNVEVIVKSTGVMFDSMVKGAQNLGSMLLNVVTPGLTTLLDMVLPLLDKMNGWFLSFYEDTLAPFVSNTIDKLSGFLSSGLMSIIMGTAEMLDPFINLVSGLGDILMDQVLPGIFKFVDMVLDVLMPIATWFINAYSFIFAPFVASVIEAFQTYILPIISDVVNIIVEDVMPMMEAAFNAFVEDLLPALYQTFNEIFPVIASVVETAFILINEVWNTILYPAIQNIISWVQYLWPIFYNTFIAIFNNVSQIFTGLVQIFGGLIDFVVGVFTGHWGKAWEGVVEIFKGIFNGLVGIIKIPLNAVISLINGAIDGINSIGIDIPDWVPDFLGAGKSFRPNISHIPFLAKGTNNWLGGRAMIGERGPELVTGPTITDLDPGSRVIPADKTQDLLNQSNNNSVTSVGDTTNNNTFIIQVNSEDGKIPDSELERMYKFLKKKLDEEILGGGGGLYDY
jgi:TP901 family phage tail tape measure protein